MELSSEQKRNVILENGFFFLDDAVVGQNMERMDEEGIPLASAAGFLFCKANVLENPGIRSILDLFFEWFGLGLYRSFGARHGDYVFQKNDPDYPEMDGRCLLVHLLRKGSTVTLWKGSHRYSLPYIKGENNLWLVPRASLKRFDLSPVSYTFKQGGLYVNAPLRPQDINEN
ncbi:enoyl-CoA hydratase/isomerase family protein [Purpureocillium lavendulum]|uniref:Enoyl-CoA hydratase/isomerase family protein n=1 Tax=Purpureocillium lavendulum TaxID=1247861 RepID=A0AB34FFS5_9HYPO|nr:enoyl-CoA hydratase/isomerase family protein [Purpureocillium lavendulum]